MSSLFRFKQFNVNQSGSAMKINTDGVLLGAFAEQSQPNRILDIGTGTGVIAMMLAQRYPEARIDAVEKDEHSSFLASQNFKESIFADRLTAYAEAFQDFNPPGLYDLIVSNPPFFLNALQNPDKRKSQARHASLLFYDDLIAKTATWLPIGGYLQLILPPDIAAYMVHLAYTAKKFNHIKTIHLKSFVDSKPFRQIIFLERGEPRQDSERAQQYFTLYENKGVYSSEYKSLLKPFFLNF